MYYPYFKTIKHYLNKSGLPYWVKGVLLRDNEFLNDANEWCELHYLFPTRYPLKAGLKDIIRQYSRQALESQFYVKKPRLSILKKIFEKISDTY